MKWCRQLKSFLMKDCNLFTLYNQYHGLLMTWRRMEPGHQLPWYWRSSVTFWPEPRAEGLTDYDVLGKDTMVGSMAWGSAWCGLHWWQWHGPVPAGFVDPQWHRQKGDRRMAPAEWENYLRCVCLNNIVEILQSETKLSASLYWKLLWDVILSVL